MLRAYASVHGYDLAISSQTYTYTNIIEIGCSLREGEVEYRE